MGIISVSSRIPSFANARKLIPNRIYWLTLCGKSVDSYSRHLSIHDLKAILDPISYTVFRFFSFDSILGLRVVAKWLYVLNLLHPLGFLSSPVIPEEEIGFKTAFKIAEQFK